MAYVLRLALIPFWVSWLTGWETAIGVYKGVQSLMRKSKVKGPVSQLIDYWNNVSVER